MEQPTKVKCLYCGEEFERKDDSPAGNFCGTECMEAYNKAQAAAAVATVTSTNSAAETIAKAIGS